MTSTASISDVHVRPLARLAGRVPLMVLLLAPFASAGAQPVPVAEGSPVVAAEVTRLLADVATSVDGRNRARARLIELGSAATRALIENTASPLAPVRWEIVNVMGNVRDPAAIDALIDRVLRDDDAHVRWRSIWALCEYPAPDRTRIAEHFRASLAGPPGTERWNAVVGASMMGVSEVLPDLQAGVVDRTEFHAWEAVNGLARFPDRSSVAALRQALARHEPRLRREATLSLGKIRADAARDVLLELLADGDEEVRWRAAMVIEEFPEPMVEAAVKARLGIEGDAMVRGKLEHALKILADKSEKRPARE